MKIGTLRLTNDKVVNLRLPKPLWDALKAEAEAKGQSPSSLLLDILQERLSERFWAEVARAMKESHGAPVTVAPSEIRDAGVRAALDTGADALIEGRAPWRPNAPKRRTPKAAQKRG
jgi:sirohydrochlorin ferrochelatase